MRKRRKRRRRRRGVRRENKRDGGGEGAAKRGLLKFRGAVGLSSLSQSLVESVSFRLAGCLCKFMPARQTCVASASAAVVPSFGSARPEDAARRGEDKGAGGEGERANNDEDNRKQVEMIRCLGWSARPLEGEGQWAA